MSMIVLRFRWSTSRAQNTYGYNICTLFARPFGQPEKKVGSCNGGNYDMVGTVVGEWLRTKFQDRLLKLKGQYYGLSFSDDRTKAYLDGACGVECMERVALAIGVQIKWHHDKKGNREGGDVIVYDNFDVVKMEGLRQRMQAQYDKAREEDVAHGLRKMQVDVTLTQDEKFWIEAVFPKEQGYNVEYSPV